MNSNKDAIAIVGIGCRFPGAINSVNDFWSVVSAGVDAVSVVPADRWSAERYHSQVRSRKGKTVSKWGGFIDGLDQFDPVFFGISPREADVMDPQQRKLLEVTWEAFEDGGMLPENYRAENVGVFIGGFTLDYKLIQFSEIEEVSMHTAVGSMMTMLSNRISHTFDFCGPSMSIDTACSSSLVSIHTACKSIARGECNMAVAGGVLLHFVPHYTVAESAGSFLSADGRSKSFDASANGYVRGEGVGVVLLKPLADALADGNNIYAVIRGSAVNQDGHTNGITVPSSDAQRCLIRKACADAGVDLADIQYVEAHGTGTPTGDPIEMSSIGSQYGQAPGRSAPLTVGSVKSNFGHTEAAAGVAGVIKACLAMERGQIPPNVHFRNPNPAIDFAGLNLRVPTSLENWPVQGVDKLASVNSFGFGGTNAHVVLERPASLARVEPLPEPTLGQVLLTISAKSEKSLNALVQRYRDRLADDPDLSIYQLAYNACHLRTRHDKRAVFVASDREQLLTRMDAYLRGEATPFAVRGDAGRSSSKLVFVCSGMGPQWWAMGRQLLEKEPVFRAAMAQCDQELAKYADWSLLEELTRPEAESRMEETQIAQPANFALQVSLAALWASWGVTPSAIVGHSAGEAAAAYLAGVYTLEEAAKVIFYRSFLQQKTSGLGTMAAVGLSHEDALRALAPWGDKLAVAANNAPQSVTVVGSQEDLASFAKALDPAIFFKYLRVSVPYHSKYLDPIEGDMLAALADVQARPARLPLYSTALGKRTDGPEWDAQYWWKNVRDSVLFVDAVSAILGDGYDEFLEVSPHPVLSGSIKQIMTDRGGNEGKVFHSLRRNEDEQVDMLANLAALYCAGHEIDWQFFLPLAAPRIKLPLYAWDHGRHWSESKYGRIQRLGEMDHRLLGSRENCVVPTWQATLGQERLPYLAGHVIQGNTLYPAAGYLEMALAAAATQLGQGTYALENVHFLRASFLKEDENLKLRTVLDETAAMVRIHGTAEVDWVDAPLAAECGIRKIQGQGRRQGVHLADLQRRCTGQAMSAQVFYQQLTTMGFQYGPDFQGIREVYHLPGEVLAKLEVPASVAAELGDYHFHPAVLDACFHAFIAVELQGGAAGDSQRIPVAIDRYTRHGAAQATMWVHVKNLVDQDRRLSGDIAIYGDGGTLIALLEGFSVAPLDDGKVAVSSERLDSWLYASDWLPEEAPAEAQASAPSLAGQHWLILMDRTGLGQSVKQLLEARGATVACILAGDAYQVTADDVVTVRPQASEDFAQAFSALAAKGVDGVLHAWNLDFAEAGTPSLDLIAQAQRKGAFSINSVLKALTEGEIKTKFWLVTRAAQAVIADGDPVSLLQLPAWGVGRVAGNQEQVSIWGGMIDLDSQADATESARLVRQITEPDDEDQVAFRQGQRFLARIGRVRSLTRPLPCKLRQDACYLVVGAFGSLGRITAQWLQRQGATCLILTGTQDFPERSTWDSLSTDHPAYERVALVRALELSGTRVFLTRFDGKDPESFRRFLDQYQADGWPAIKGVLYVSGIVDDRLLVNMSEQSFQKVFFTKAVGAWAMHELFRDVDLDFFVLYSSIAALMGVSGQTNYAAANAFLDGLAQYRRSQGLPALSIGWGPWATGMIKDLNLGQLYAERGMGLIEAAPGMALLGRLLGQELAHTAVLAAEWDKINQGFSRQNAPYLRAVLDTGDTGSSELGIDAFRTEYARAPAEGQMAVIESHMAAVVAKVMRMNVDNLDATTPLHSYGIDSLMATELRNRVDQHLGVSLPLVEILNNATVRHLSELAQQRLLPPEEESLEELLDEAGMDDLLALLEEVDGEAV